MDKNSNWQNIVLKCPHCKSNSTFSCVFSAMGKSQGEYHPFSVWVCHYCDKGIFIKQQSSQYKHVVEGSINKEVIYPADEPNVSEHIPAGIAEDYIEALKCYNFSAYKACVVMARRTIQKTCLNLGADKSKKLWEQIKELNELGKLHSDLSNMATEIRYLGNDAAHPSTDEIDEVNSDDAKEILDFTNELLDDLYVRPEKIRKMQIKREERKNIEIS